MGHKGLIVSAPFTGSGKTTVTLGLLRALAKRGVAPAPAKVGPDYIDPQFHEAASGKVSVNLDGWAMRPAIIRSLVANAAADADMVVVEGVMGLFDGAYKAGHHGIGSTADIARLTGWPVVLVVNCGKVGQSVAALIHGFQSYDPEISVAGAILNNVATQRHKEMLLGSLECAGIRVLGCLPRQKDISLPSRHLGLVQAEEQDNLDVILDRLAEIVTDYTDLDAISALARPVKIPDAKIESSMLLQPPGQRIALANDEAFRFSYEHVLHGWRAAGAEIFPFSPLADEAPAHDADAIYLPGGYPELHAGKLAAAMRFKEALRDAANRGAAIFGECGGYMVLGQGIIDSDGVHHEMAGLLDLETSFEKPRLHIGYRRASAMADFALGRGSHKFRTHEFHHAVVLREEGDTLFRDLDDGQSYGLRSGTVSGSFLHVIDQDDG